MIKKFISDENLSQYSNELKSTVFNPNIENITLNTTVKNIYSNAFSKLYVSGTKYGQYYGVDSIWGTSNYYISPNLGTVYSKSNPAVLYTTKGTLKLIDSSNNVKLSKDLDLCGNDNISDEIIGTVYTKRWSDNFLFGKNLNWTVGDVVNNHVLYTVTMSDAEFGRAPAHFTSDTVANLIANTFKTEAYDTVVAGTNYSSVGMYWDETENVHKVAFRVVNGTFASPLNFAIEMGSTKSYMQLIFRYELAEPIITPLAITPIVINTGDKLIFEPTYQVDSKDMYENPYVLTSNPKECYLEVYKNIGAKIKGENEQNLLLSLVEQALNGTNDTNTIVSENVSGDTITIQLQKEINNLSQTGGIVYIKEGTYTTTDTITIPANVSVVGLGSVTISTTNTSSNIFDLKCGASLKNIIIKTPLNFTANAVLIGGDDVHYNELSTGVDNIKIIGTTAKDESGASTSFTGKGIAIIANHVNNSYSTVYNAYGNNVKVYNMEYGVYVYADMITDFIANTYFQNMYIENCYIGIFDKGFTSAFIGYTIQTKPNNLYGVECYGGYYVGHVYDLDLYWDGDSTRPNIGHPKIGYFLGGGEYSFISDPVFTEYQGKYGYEWDNVRPEKKLSFIDNSWDVYRTVNETVAPLKLNGNEQCKAKERYIDFNGLIDNYICYANEKYTVTTNITDNDIISGKIEDMFNPHTSRIDSLRLNNRTVDNPYVITIDFGKDILLSAIGMDFDSIPRYVKMEAYNSTYDTSKSTGVEFSDDNFIQVLYKTDNRLSVVQSTWSGTGFSLASKLRFSFADASSVIGTDIIPKNIYAYNVSSMSDTYMPSIGGHIYNDGNITINENHQFTKDNELVSKKYVDTSIQSSINDSIITITKNLLITEDWINTGITGEDIGTGTYIVQVSGFDSDITLLSNEIFSGIMSSYAGSTSDTDTNEIILHQAGASSSANCIYLRTVRTSGKLNLQIAANKTFTASTPVIFKFRKMM